MSHKIKNSSDIILINFLYITSVYIIHVRVEFLLLPNGYKIDIFDICHACLHNIRLILSIIIQ